MTTRAPTDSLPPPSQGERRSLMPPPPPKFVERQVNKIAALIEGLGAVVDMLFGAVRAGFRRPFEGRAILQQVEALGVASVGIVTVTSVFIGMVMAVQFAFGLRKFGGMGYTGRVVVLSFMRELAPSLTAGVVGGRLRSGVGGGGGVVGGSPRVV